MGVGEVGVDKVVSNLLIYISVGNFLFCGYMQDLLRISMTMYIQWNLYNRHHWEPTFCPL